MTPRIVRLSITLTNVPRVIRGLVHICYRPVNAVVREDRTSQYDREVKADFDFGRYDSEGETYVAEMLQCRVEDIISIEEVSR
jgi:hypothetical protein